MLEWIVPPLALVLAIGVGVFLKVMGRYVEPKPGQDAASPSPVPIITVDDPEQNERVLVLTSPRLARQLKQQCASKDMQLSRSGTGEVSDPKTTDPGA